MTTAAARYKMRVQKKYSGTNAYAFTATATKLAAGTRCAYRIVTSGGSTAWTTFSTARAGLDRPWTFLAFGDTNYQGVRFIVLDTFGGDLEQQSAFLDTALETNRQRWTVVLQHAGPFASRSDRNDSAIRSAFQPLYDKYKVDPVLSGHDPSYNRGYDGSKDSTVYAVSDSGPTFYEASTKDWTRGGAIRVVSASHTSTYQRVTVSNNTLVYQDRPLSRIRQGVYAVRYGDQQG